MTKDSRENLDYGYNFLNLLCEVKQGVTTKATYRWLADGTKAGVKNPSGTNGFEYLGTMVYARNPQGGLALESASFGGGRVVKTSGGYEIHYHVTDHLGNVRATHYTGTTAVTMNDYYAFGKRHNNSSLPIARGDSGNRWQFNGKEKQLVGDVGFLDFGARMYNPEIARMQTPDPLAEADRKTSPFAYARNNPINAIDLEGKLVIFVNGMHGGSGGKADYWEGFDTAVMEHLNDFNSRYYDGAVGGTGGLYMKSQLGPTYSNLDPSVRYAAGYSTGKREASSILDQLVDGEKIKIITHSMGAAYGKGLIQALIDTGIDPALFEFEADFAPFQPGKQKANPNVATYQFSHDKDWVAGNKPMDGAKYMDTSSDANQTHWIPDFWNQIKNLPSGNYRIENGQIIPNK